MASVCGTERYCSSSAPPRAARASGSGRARDREHEAPARELRSPRADLELERARAPRARAPASRAAGARRAALPSRSHSPPSPCVGRDDTPRVGRRAARRERLQREPRESSAALERGGELRERRLEADLLGGRAVDAERQQIREARRDRVPKRSSTSSRTVFGPGRAGRSGSARIPRDAAPRQERAREQRAQRRRDRHELAVRDHVRPCAARRDEREARGVASDSSAAFPRTVFGPRSIRYAPRRTVSAAPPARGAASSTSTSSTALRDQLGRAGEAGDAGADDDGVRAHHGADSWTVRTKVATASTGVRCSTPWPRFTMWPRALRPARTSSRVARASSGQRREQRRRIQVPLQRDALADARRGLREIDAPVERDDVGAEVRELVEQVRRAAREDDQRRALRARAARSRAAARGPRSARSALPRACPPRCRRSARSPRRPRSQAERLGADLDHALEQAVEQARLAQRERGEHLEIARELRLGRVGRERPRRAGEADQRRLRAELAAQPANRFAGRRDRGVDGDRRDASRSPRSRSDPRRPARARTRARGPPPRSGSRMSENTTTPSMPKRRNGWSETSTARSGESHIARNRPSRAARGTRAGSGRPGASARRAGDRRARRARRARSAREGRAPLEWAASLTAPGGYERGRSRSSAKRAGSRARRSDRAGRPPC